MVDLPTARILGFRDFEHFETCRRHAREVLEGLTRACEPLAHSFYVAPSPGGSLVAWGLLGASERDELELAARQLYGRRRVSRGRAVVNGLDRDVLRVRP